MLKIKHVSGGPETEVQWSPSIMDTTGTTDFVLYSEVSLAQGVIVDQTPLTIVASYAGATWA